MTDLNLQATLKTHDKRFANNGVIYCGDGCGDWPCQIYQLASEVDRMKVVVACAVEAHAVCRLAPIKRDGSSGVAMKALWDAVKSYLDNSR